MPSFQYDAWAFRRGRGLGRWSGCALDETGEPSGDLAEVCIDRRVAILSRRCWTAAKAA